MTVLQLEALSRSYGGRPVLRGLNAAVRRGEIAVLMGGSGSGKTTLLRITAGLEAAEAGCVRLRGVVVDGPGRRPVPPERRGLGMVFQEHALWPHLSVRENVMIAAPPGGAPPGPAAMALLDAVELAHLADRRPATLSGGQQQRVALARALATGSDLLLLDEPLSSLDEMVRDRLRPLVRDMLRREGRAALFVSHDRLDAWRVADRILVLEDGALSQADAPQTLYAAPATASVARYMGAGGRLRVQGDGPRQVRTCGGQRLAAVCAGLASGMAGFAVAHPDGVQVTTEEGLPATRLDCVFEAGQWRTRWQVGGGELLGLHRTPPPDRAQLAIDPAKLFAFPGDS